MKPFSPTDGKAIPVTVVTQGGLKKWRAARSANEKKWLTVNKFAGAPGQLCLIPGADGSLSRVVLGISDPLEIWDTADLARNLPDGLYRLDGVRGKEAERVARVDDERLAIRHLGEVPHHQRVLRPVRED